MFAFWSRGTHPHSHAGKNRHQRQTALREVTGEEDLAEGSSSLKLPPRVQETKSAVIFLDRLLTFSTFTLLCQFLWVLQLSHCSNFLKPSPRVQSHPKSGGGNNNGGKSLALDIGIVRQCLSLSSAWGETRPKTS